MDRLVLMVSISAILSAASRYPNPFEVVHRYDLRAKDPEPRKMCLNIQSSSFKNTPGYLMLHEQ